MIWTLVVRLVRGRFAEGPWKGTIEIDSTATLDELHDAIQTAVNFDDDHLYEFYIARTNGSRSRASFSCDGGDPRNVFEMRLENLFPIERNYKLYYLFDYGDHWLFQISKRKKAGREPEEGVRYPRWVDEVGLTPMQYGRNGEEE